MWPEHVSKVVIQKCLVRRSSVPPGNQGPVSCEGNWPDKSADMDQGQVSQAGGKMWRLWLFIYKFVQIVIAPDEAFVMIVIQKVEEELEEKENGHKNKEENIKAAENT